MAPNDPFYFQSIPLRQDIQQKEFLFHLYLFQHTQAKASENQRIIILPTDAPNDFGCAAVNEWTIRDGPALNANIVAHARGLHVGASMSAKNWFLCFNIEFTDQRFKASSLKVLGSFIDKIDGEWAIVGGTGEFAFTQGVVSYKVVNDTTKELHIRALCHVIPTPTLVTKIGPWGGTQGTDLDMPHPVAPQRLESVTVTSGLVIDSIAFSYTEPTGKKHDLGPWGGRGELTEKITLAPSEVVLEISGTTGYFGEETVVTSLVFVTNVKTYGPFGKPSGTAFSVPLKDTNIVGFFARAGRRLNALGVYARLSVST